MQSDFGPPNRPQDYLPQEGLLSRSLGSILARDRGTPKEQTVHKTHIMWKDETLLPIPSIRDTNEQIDNIFGEESY
jgi:hypothetical protein